jgi:hypothetical protein
MVVVGHTQHSAAAPARTSRTRAARPRVRNLVLLVGRRPSPDHRPRATGGRGRRRSDVGASGSASGGSLSWRRLCRIKTETRLEHHPVMGRDAR